MNFKPKFLRRFAATSSGQQDALIFDPQGALNGSEQDPAMQERTGRRAVLDGKRVFRVVALLCIAWGAGQLMQVVGPSNATQQLALAQEAVIGTTSEAEVTLASLGVDTALGIVAAPGAEAVVTLADRPALDPVAPAPGEPAALASADAAVSSPSRFAKRAVPAFTSRGVSSNTTSTRSAAGVSFFSASSRKSGAAAGL